MRKRSLAALVACALGLLGLFDVALGPILIHLGWVTPMFGFQWMFGLGLLEGLLALVVGLLALWRTRPAAGRPGRPLAWIGTGAGVALVTLLVMSALPGLGLPRINDITTDLDDPPAFVAARRDPAFQGRDLSYPPSFAPSAAEEQRAAYADLGPIHSSHPPAEALEHARRTAEALGWEIVEVAAGEGRLEARQVSRVFRFVDDVVVRVRPYGAGSIVDVRSRSRDGRGDLGVNAQRIRAFAAEFRR